jgi:hypothetical protein
MITILAYPGHDGGDIETARARSWCERPDSKQFTVHILTAAANKAPVLFAIYKTA